MQTIEIFCHGCFKSTKILTARCVMGLHRERKALSLRNIFFADFAKNLYVFSAKRLLRQPLYITCSLKNGIYTKDFTF